LTSIHVGLEFVLKFNFIGDELLVFSYEFFFFLFVEFYDFVEFFV